MEKRRRKRTKRGKRKEIKRTQEAKWGLSEVTKKSSIARKTNLRERVYRQEFILRTSRSCRVHIAAMLRLQKKDNIVKCFLKAYLLLPNIFDIATIRVIIRNSAYKFSQLRTFLGIEQSFLRYRETKTCYKYFRAEPSFSFLSYGFHTLVIGKSSVN